MKILDLYIIKKFLGTFFYAISLIIIIAIIFDVSEKIDDFIEKKAPLSSIVFDYYLNFIPYFVNLFSPLFVFISVIYFTSRLANDTEIVAILGSGISFNRLLRPYLFSAFVLVILGFTLNSWVIPKSNSIRLEFENTYIRNPYIYKARHIHRQIEPGVFIYFESFNNLEKMGYLFSIETYEENNLKFKLMSDYAAWDSINNKWSIRNYITRNINEMEETVTKGAQLDTALNFTPEEFTRRISYIEAMNTPELNDFIEQERMRGSENLSFYLVEKYKRTSTPFAIFILTAIGVALSSRKVRGGLGAQLGIGIGISFIFILFMQVSNTFATNGNVPAIIAVWIPNLVFAFVAVYLLRKAPK